MSDVLFLKWGLLKNWGSLESESAKKALSEILDNPKKSEDKESIINVINSCEDGIFILDFYDAKVTKQEAIDYVRSGGNGIPDRLK